MVSIRLTSPDDVPALQRIAIDTLVTTFGPQNAEANIKAYLDRTYGLDTLRQELTETGSRNYLAFFGNELAGFMRLRENNEAQQLLGKNAIELQRLYVIEKVHGRKIGAALMREGMDYAKQTGYAWIWLGVWEGNPKAQEFYARWGFERFSEHVFLMGDDAQKDWLLKRRL